MDLIESAAYRLASSAASHFSLSDRPQLLHSNRQCIFAFPKDGKVLRIHSLEDTENTVLLERSRALAARMAGVLTPYQEDTPPPITLKGRVIECLPLLRRLPGQPAIDFSQLGQQLQSLHSMPLSGLVLPEITPLERLEERIAKRPISKELSLVLESRMPAMREFWKDIKSRYDDVFLHGNVFRSNIIRCESGQHLIDFHAGGLGPWLFDLSCINLSSRRFSLHPIQYKKVLRHYGRDISVKQEMDIDKMVDILEIMSLGWLHSRHDARADLELSWRLRTLDTRIPWHRF